MYTVLMLFLLLRLYYEMLMEHCDLLICIVTGNSLKRKCHHFDGIFITGCTGSCHFDNFQCSQWWKFCQNDNISVSVLGTHCKVALTEGSPRKGRAKRSKHNSLWVKSTNSCVSQHWFRLWLGAVRQQAITRTDVDPYLCRHIWRK